MADRVLVVSWGQPVRGREQHGLEVLAEATALYGELQEAGRIDSFDLILMDPNTFMNGCFILHGTHDQLDAVREDMRFRRSIIDAELSSTTSPSPPATPPKASADPAPLHRRRRTHPPDGLTTPGAPRQRRALRARRRRARRVAVAGSDNAPVAETPAQ